MSFSKFGQDESEWSRHVRDILDEMRKRDFVQFRDEQYWQPATDVYESRDLYYICVDLAGVERETIDVTCSDTHTISVSGYRGNPRPQGHSGPLSVHVMEIDHGPFRREVRLPESFDMNAVEAVHDKGYLWITLPKTESK